MKFQATNVSKEWQYNKKKTSTEVKKTDMRNGLRLTFMYYNIYKYK